MGEYGTNSSRSARRPLLKLLVSSVVCSAVAHFTNHHVIDNDSFNDPQAAAMQKFGPGGCDRRFGGPLLCSVTNGAPPLSHDPLSYQYLDDDRHVGISSNSGPSGAMCTHSKFDNYWKY